jgi:predicted dithiol-disulfide oxidoreductase (DUF899 family)
MHTNKVVSREEWLVARRVHLDKEKAFDRARDELSQERRKLPWVKFETAYEFDGAEGVVSLADLFQQNSQLVIYHFMFHPDWDEGCPSCSFWADNFDRIIVHLNQRDVSMAVISRTPVEQIEAFRNRMGWDVQWLSSFRSDFNRDFQVSFTPEQIESGDVTYNYKKRGFNGPEAPGVSVFFKDTDGVIFHTYSTFGRGLDKLNAAYHYLDIVPKGRDEEGLPYAQAWVRHHDRYNL